MRRPQLLARTPKVALATLGLLLLAVVPALALTNDNYSAPTNIGGSKSGIYTDAQNVTYDGSGYTIAVVDGAFYPNAPQFKDADGSNAVLFERCIGQTGGSFPSLCSSPSTANRSAYPWESRTGSFVYQSGTNASRPSNAPGNTCADPGNAEDGFCQATHGNWTAGIALGRPAVRNDATLGMITYSGVAPGARLAAFKIGGGSGTQASSGWPADSVLDALDMIEAIARANDSGALRKFPITAVSISASGGASSTEGPCSAGSDGARIDAQAARLKQYGIAVVLAAGNAGKTAATGTWTCGQNVVVVGATDVSSPTAPTSYTNLSSNVDLLAPVGVGWPCPGGNCIFSTYKDSGGSSSVSGTSFATPQVAGALAVLRQKYPLASVDRLVGLLKSSGDTLTGARAGQAPNAKVLDLDAALDTQLPWQ